MPRFRTHGELDDPFLEDGDLTFVGVDNFTEPSLLEAGMVHASINMRFDGGVAKVRKGCNKIVTFTDEISSLLTFRDPDGVEDVVAVTTNNINYLTSIIKTHAPALASPVSNKANALQIFNNILVFDMNQRPQKSDGISAFVQLPTTPSINDGSFITCPDAPFGQYIANRLIVPNYADGTTSIIASDIFDENNFQVANAEFFMNKGTNDLTLGFLPYQDNQMIVLNSRSIHIVSNLHSLESASFEITRQYGVSGPRAFCQSGSYVYFMSNEGNIQVMVPGQDPAKGLGLAISKMTLDSEPLSKPINRFLEQINLDALGNVIVKYHRNRVYFAIPINGTGSDQEPNCIAVYNSLRSRWESIDVLKGGLITIRDMASYKNKLYIASPHEVYEYETTTSDDGDPVTGKIITRDYNLGTRDIKKFVRGSLGYFAENQSSIDISVSTKNPNKKIVSKTITEDDDENFRMTRFNARQRGYSASVEVNITSGSNFESELQRVSLEGFVGNSRTGGSFDGN